MKTTFETTDPVKIINEKISEGMTLFKITSWDLRDGRRNYLVTFLPAANKPTRPNTDEEWRCTGNPGPYRGGKPGDWPA